MKRLAVYCGSAKGNHPDYEKQAIELIRVMRKQNIGLVYGGGNVGLMGVIADEMLRLGGEVIGVIPKKLFEKEVAHQGITELIVVNDMHERKMKIFELCDACVALPGGIGTMEELFEAFTWSQLGFHNKPCGVLNVNGYYNLLNNFLSQMVEQGFLKQQFKSMLLFDTNAEQLISRLRAFEFPENLKWS